MDPQARDAAPVGVFVARGIAPEAACRAGPRLANHQLADLPAHWIALLIYDIRRDTGHGSSEGARLDRRNGGTANDAAGDLRAAGVVDDRTLTAADDLEAPVPGD